MNTQLANRVQAGQYLAQKLILYQNRPDVFVLALPRGGVPIGFEIAHRLHLPLDICLVRKIGVPNHRELAMGAVARGNIVWFNHEIIRSLHISQTTFNRVKALEIKELHRREAKYRGQKPFPDLKAKTVILVDDGIATGATMEVAILSLKSQQTAKIIVAVPVAPPSVCQILAQQVDEVVCLMEPESFTSLSLWYEDFSQVKDEEVCQLLAQNSAEFN